MMKNKSKYFEPVIKKDYDVTFAVILPMKDDRVITTGKVRMKVSAGSQADANAKAYFFINKKLRIVIVEGDPVDRQHPPEDSGEAAYEASAFTPRVEADKETAKSLFKRMDDFFNEKFWK